MSPEGAPDGGAPGSAAAAGVTPGGAPAGGMSPAGMSPGGVPAAGAPLLEVRGLVKRFGGFRALDGVSLHLRAGEVLGLVGPNGSGKTTCINVVSGLHRSDGGTVVFEGASVDRVPAHRRAWAGINRTFQSPHCFGSLTVLENVQVAATYGHARGSGGNQGPPDLHALLAGLELDGLRHRPAAELNSAQAKMLDLARALATAPRLLLVDELAAGLNPAELGRVAARLRTLAAEGMALLVVEHLMGFLEMVTSRVVVMNAGREIFEGALASAVRDPEVVRVFLGGPPAAGGAGG